MKSHLRTLTHIHTPTHTEHARDNKQADSVAARKVRRGSTKRSSRRTSEQAEWQRWPQETPSHDFKAMARFLYMYVNV